MDPISFLIEVKHNLLNEPGSYDAFLQTINDFEAQKFDIIFLIKELTKLFHGKQSLIMGFNGFLPEEYKIVSEDDNEALCFVKRVETTLKYDPGAFINFLQIMDTYNRKKKSIIEVYKEIENLFEDHNDLFTEFKTFLPGTSFKRLVSPPLDMMRARKKRKIEEDFKKKRIPDEWLTFFDKVKATRCDSETCQRLLTCVELYKNKVVTRQELRELVDDLTGDNPELIKGFDNFMENSEKNTKPEDVSLSKSIEENIEDLNLSKCEEIGPSYRLLPIMNCRKPSLMQESLNDECVCWVPKKDGFKHGFKNQYVVRLFKCEDEIFKLDMEIELIIMTIKKSEDLMPEVKKSHHMGKNSYLCLEEQFTKPELECIQNLFKKNPKFLDSLRVNAHVLLPVALKQLMLKQEELAQQHKDSAVKWRNIFKNNHIRSLGLI